MADYSKIHTNQRLLLQELERRGVEIEVLVPELEIAEARFLKHVELLVDRDSSVMPYAATLLSSDKYLSKLFLRRAGLPVPRGEQFYADQFLDVARYIKSLKSSFVFKPTIGSHGEFCFMDLQTVQDFELVLEKFVLARGRSSAFLIEEQIAASEYRVFITRRKQFAVLHRDPAHVVGDGRSTISELVEQINHERTAPRKNALCPIVLDSNVVGLLKQSKYDLSSVPLRGQKVYLRRNSNLATGGFCEDFTDRVHPEIVELAFRALRTFPRLPYAGIDLMTADISAAPSTAACYILEVNSNPGLHMHVRPGAGQSQNVAAYVADMIFPETYGR